MSGWFVSYLPFYKEIYKRAAYTQRVRIALTPYNDTIFLTHCVYLTLRNTFRQLQTTRLCGIESIIFVVRVVLHCCYLYLTLTSMYSILAGDVFVIAAVYLNRIHRCKIQITAVENNTDYENYRFNTTQSSYYTKTLHCSFSN